jgi:AraC-like DNA-binding protein
LLLKALNKFDKRLKAAYSAIETVNLRWLKHFTWIYLSWTVITFILLLSQNLGFLPIEINQVFGIVYGVLVCSVFYLNYQVIQHYALSQVYPSQGDFSTAIIALAPEKHKANNDSDNTHLLNDKEKALETEIIPPIERENLYLEPTINLESLASRLRKSRHQISKIINVKEDRSFYDLINGYRVKHLQKMLDNPKKKQFTILSLGLESGFNSKESLNRIFNNTKGLTPKQHLNTKSQPIP